MLFFGRSYKVRLKVVEDHASEALFDLAALSGSTEISLETEEGSGVKYITKFGVSVGPSSSNIDVPSQIITMVPRHVILNESGENITVRQCNLEVCVCQLQFVCPFCSVCSHPFVFVPERMTWLA